MRAAARPFRLGEFDCGLWGADWCVEVTGRDPAAGLRGRYSTEAELAALGGWRGVPGLFAQGYRSIGIGRTVQPATGDVALLSISGAPVVGAIVLQSVAFVLSQGGGVSRVPLSYVRVVAAWGLNG